MNPQLQQPMGQMGQMPPQPMAQQPTLPQKGQSAQFSSQHDRVYQHLRDTLGALMKQGIPGLENVLHALNKEHVNQMKQGAQIQPKPNLPSQPPQMPMNPVSNTGSMA